MTTAAITLLAAEGEKGGHVPFGAPPWAVGIGAFVGLALLLLITLSFGKDR